MPWSATRPLYSGKLNPSSRAWLSRQFRDPYVRERANSPLRLRSRSAYKLLELDSKWKFFQPDVHTVVDLGAAPGGWSQIAAWKLGWTEEDVVGIPTVSSKGKAKTKSAVAPPSSWSGEMLDRDSDPWDELEREVIHKVGKGTIIAVDLLRMLPIPGVRTVQMDFLSPEADAFVNGLAKGEQNSEGKVDLVLSDMAANLSGNRLHDIESCLDVCHAATTFARKHLRTHESIGRRKGGVLVLKYFEHPLMAKFRHDELKPYFNGVYNSKPDASRSESSEGYWICMGFRRERHRPPPKNKERIDEQQSESDIRTIVEVP